MLPLLGNYIRLGHVGIITFPSDLSIPVTFCYFFIYFYFIKNKIKLRHKKKNGQISENDICE